MGQAGNGSRRAPHETASGIVLDPLDYWLLQESLPLPDDPHAGNTATKDEGRMTGGWWILPALLLSLPIWGLLGWAFIG